MAEVVYVLGCGPAGLLAAHAVALAGHEPRILSRKVKSEIGGAQYLHSEIPGIARPEEAWTITFIKCGSMQGYAKKVYGDPDMKTSWETYEKGDHEVWNMRQAYDRLWAEYEHQIQDIQLNPTDVEHLAEHTFVISTVPKMALCPDPQNYDWHQQPVWIRYGQTVRDCIALPEEIIMSGNEEDVWYRQSNLFGWKGVEFPVEVGGSVRIMKPLSTTYPGVPGVLHLGRYGEWRKTVLVHEVFHRAHQFLTEI
jgi:hypothetical protein